MRMALNDSSKFASSCGLFIPINNSPRYPFDIRRFGKQFRSKIGEDKVCDIAECETQFLVLYQLLQ
jgi:hypothetical protein